MDSLFATISYPRYTRHRASDGNVKSSTIAPDDGMALIKLAGEAACDFKGTARRKRESVIASRSCIGIPPAKAANI